MQVDFEKLDTDGDGVVSKDELAAALDSSCRRVAESIFAKRVLLYLLYLSAGLGHNAGIEGRGSTCTDGAFGCSDLWGPMDIYRELRGQRT